MLGASASARSTVPPQMRPSVLSFLSLYFSLSFNPNNALSLCLGDSWRPSRNTPTPCLPACLPPLRLALVAVRFVLHLAAEVRPGARVKHLKPRRGQRRERLGHACAETSGVKGSKGQSKGLHTVMLGGYFFCIALGATTDASGVHAFSLSLSLSLCEAPAGACAGRACRVFAHPG